MTANATGTEVTTTDNEALKAAKAHALSGTSGYIVLTREEEALLGRAAGDGDTEAAWGLCMANRNFVRSLCSRYQRSNMELEDLVADAMLGLMEAAVRFDPARGVKFITYGSWWIKRAILRHVRTFEHPVHVPKYRQYELHEMNRTKSRLSQELGRAPSLSELCEATGQTERAVQEGLALASGAVPLSDATDDEVEALQSTDDIEQAVIMSDALLRLDDVLSVLTDRERNILEQRFGLQGRETTTLSELGARIGLTKERVRQIEKQACERLGKAMEDAGVVRRSRRRVA